MKKLVFFIFVFFIFGTVLFAQKNNDSPRIEIKYVDPNLSSKSEVSCEKFESSFEESAYRNYTETDSFLLGKLKEAYEKITYYKEPDDIDVRYKLSVFFSGNKKGPLVIYMDNHNEAMINGQSVRNEKFFNLLKKVIALIPKEFSSK